MTTTGKVDNVPGYTYMGCFVDDTNRILDAAFKTGNDITVESCGQYCNGGISPNRYYQYMGVEYGSQCYCGSSFNKTLQAVSDSKCTMTCSGNDSEFCGATWFIGVYGATEVSNGTSTISSSASTSALSSPR